MVFFHAARMNIGSSRTFRKMKWQSRETVMRQCELWVDETEYESKAGAALPQRVC
jgi:hypothetical protein